MAGTIGGTALAPSTRSRHMTSPHTRAIRIERLGRPGVLVERYIPLRLPGAGEVSIRVEAAGVNFADLLMRAGLYGTVPPRPSSPGFEVAGVVSGVGDEVTGLREGDRVVAIMRHGGYARDVVVPAGQVFHYPASLTAVDAAAIPVVFLTAWVCLFESARVRSGETALILGAAGGVGSAAVQLAVHRGLTVIGTAGTAHKRDRVVTDLGAAACFDSRANWEPDVERTVGRRGIDVALDAVGGQATAACRRLLAPLGRLVFYGLSEGMPGQRRNWLHAARAWWRTPRFHPLGLIEPNLGMSGVHLLHLESREHILAPALAAILEGVLEGSWKPCVDRVFPFDRGGAVGAHIYLHERRNRGKVVLAAAPDRAGVSG